MIKNKFWTAMLFIGLVCLFGPSLSQAQEDAMSNAQFVGLLSDILGLEMPAESQTLSDGELFEVQANMLAERGLTLFMDVEPGAPVTYSMVIEVLYGALGGPSEATFEDKVNYVSDLGYLPLPGDGDSISHDEIVTALNNPALSGAIAEGYSLLGGGIFAALGVPVPSVAADPILEEGASPTE